MTRTPRRFLGIDPGTKRIGLSYGDALGIATPLPAIPALPKRERDRRLGESITERRITDLVVGYPYNMDDTIGPRAKETDRFIAELEFRFGLPVHRTDERLTTYQAESDLREQGRRTKRDRRTRRSGEVDSRAATLILQDYLDQLAHIE